MSKPEDSATAIAAIYSQALSLNGHISKETNFDIPSTKRQYEALKGKLLAVDPSAEGHLPTISYNEYNLISSLSSTRLTINQLCAYIEGTYATDSKEPDIQSVTGPVVNFLLMLPEYGLTVKWAVAASMLSSLEVITNTHLSKLKIPHDPSESLTEGSTS